MIYTVYRVHLRRRSTEDFCSSSIRQKANTCREKHSKESYKAKLQVVGVNIVENDYRSN